MLPYLTDKKKRVPHEILFRRSGQNRAVSKGDSKPVKVGSGGLFDLASDVGESRDVKEETK